MLASVMTRAWEELFKDMIVILLSWRIWDLRLPSLRLLHGLNKKRLGKMSIILQPGANSGLRGSKEGKTSLNWLSMSTTGPLINSLWHFEREPSDKGWSLDDDDVLVSIRDRSMWLWGREWALSCDLPLSFWRWRLIGMSPAMALMPDDGDILKAPKIQMAALLCIFPNIFRGYNRGALL